MYVERILSFNDGWSVLSTQMEGEWQDINSALEILTVENVELSFNELINEYKVKSDKNIINIIFNVRLKSILEGRFGWQDIRTRSGNAYDYIPEQLTKNGVSICVASSIEELGGNFANNFYLRLPYLYNSGKSLAFVIIAPTENTKEELIKAEIMLDDSSLLTDADCQAQLARFGLSTSIAPIVLAFFSTTASEEIIVEEIARPAVGPIAIERTIEFAPEYYQAGVGLLSYFGEVLRQKDPNTKAKVRIEQDGRTVRLHIESPAGDIETIEKELDQYALVISNQAPPETLFEQRMHIMQLESRLEVAKVEVKNAHDLKQLTEGFYSQQVRDLKQQVDALTQQVANGLLQQDKVFNLMHQQAGSHMQMQMALLTHAGMLFKDLLQEASGNQRILEAITNLHHNLLSGLTTLDVEEQIKQALATVKQEKPGLLLRIYSQVEGAALKAGATASLGWAADLIKHALPPH